MIMNGDFPIECVILQNSFTIISNEKNRRSKRNQSKKVLLRLDLNVPLKDGTITDETRIIKILPTLNYLLEKKAKIIIISHIGRPKGKFNSELSMKPVRDNLEQKLNQKIKLFSEDILGITNKDLFKNFDGNILILENIRFYSEEESNDLNFANHSLIYLFVFF